MISRLAPVLAALVCFVGLQSSAYAKPTPVRVSGRELVVHTNPVPVIVHRAFPPYWGKHVTQRQLKAGRLPPGAKR